MNEANIVERIKKLLRLSRSSNPHEAELALARAFELAHKHQVDVSTLDMAEESERIKHESFRVGRFVSFLQVRAINLVVRFFHVEACIKRQSTIHNWRASSIVSVVFVGTATDITIANYVYEFIVQQGRKQCRDYEQKEKRARRRTTTAKRRGFFQGFIYGIATQLSDRQNASVIDDSRTAIVLAEKEKQREAYLASLFPEMKLLVSRSQRKNNDALWSGYVAGKSTTINKPLTGTRECQLALE